MSVRNLELLFQPRSVAVIGASDRPQSVGATVFRNLVGGNFRGPILPVNLRRDVVAGMKAYRDVAGLPQVPDLAVICTPPQTVPGLIADLGAAGTKAAIVLTAGLAAIPEGGGRSLQQVMLDAAKPHLLRILGPNCVGLLVPGCGLNASFAHTSAHAGHIAFVSQSGALATALLDWAKSRSIGFSHFISMGDSADVDFGDVLDYLASDQGTRSILMYVESIKSSRKFMSAARAAARNKPVLLVKAGRAPEGAKAAASHTGALMGSDDVFDAAIRRAGMLRVPTLMDLFVVAETLARARPLSGDRLAIMTNGGGAGVLAADALSLGGGKLAELSPKGMTRLNAVLPSTWSHANPVDMIGDAPAARYTETLRVLLDDPGADSVLFMHAPSAIVPSREIAAACAPMIQQAKRQVLSCWLGGEGVDEARQIFAAANIPTYDTPEQSVGAFLQIVDYNRNQASLVQVPSSTPAEFTPDSAAARRLTEAALDDGRELLTEPEAKALLAAYGVSVVETRVVPNAEEATAAAAAIGFPVVLKILSGDISHKSDVGGVALGLDAPEAVRAAGEEMLKRVHALRPDAAIAGFTVQAMIRRPRAHELIVGAASDPVFGPVILFGQGGTAVEAIADRAVALPPLNMALARDLISRTRVARLLAGYRDRLPVDHEALQMVLLQISQLICDLPEIVELDINPLLADDEGVIALDARVRVARSVLPGTARLSIRPYPNELEQHATVNGSSVLLRPVRPEDATDLRILLSSAGARDLRLPLSTFIREVPQSELARLTQIDYEREMTFVVVASSGILGAVHSLTDPDNFRSEFGLVIHSDVAARGVERLLLEKLIHYLRGRGTREARCEWPANDKALTALASSLGFRTEQTLGSPSVFLTLDLGRSHDADVT
jgi:acetyltransferase